MHSFIDLLFIKLFITACPIKGQIRLECASDPSCHLACNRTEPIPCPFICNVNGCQCPVGTVIDWNKTECVLPRECEGIQYMCSYSQIIENKIRRYINRIYALTK